jgi:hypothetical protein
VYLPNNPSGPKSVQLTLLEPDESLLSIEIEQSQWGVAAIAQWQKARSPSGREWFFSYSYSSFSIVLLAIEESKSNM